MEKNYDHESLEEKWYKTWETEKLFSSKSKSQPSFIIAMPPPNVTGNLHIGHALNNTLQDIVIRYKRMCGESVKWIPGLDHGGIATESVIAKQLIKENTNKFHIGQEKFLQRTNEFVNEKRGEIIKQLKKIGCSCDWNSLQYTMNDGYTKLVNQTFKELYDQEMIYKGNYMINWCPKCSTSLSDMESISYDCDSKIYHLIYKLENEDECITVATTRPETLFGDVAIAFHPDDTRYQHLNGKFAIIPILNKKIPIIQSHLIIKDFGTGLVKITPAHDKKDFEIIEIYNKNNSNKLDFINILDKNCKLINATSEYNGLNIKNARNKIIKDLNLASIFHKGKINKCYRCETETESIISKQWFVRMKDLMRDAENTTVEFLPNFNEKLFRNWLEKDTDWCISRQIWWGHRIPIWYCKSGCEEKCYIELKENMKCEKCGDEMFQDTSVLDTWFSSGLWAYGPENYNLSLMITGKDILYFWVSLMIIFTKKFKNRNAFPKVLLHGIVRDEKGIKMSKSLGNGIDPLDVIKKYGADALRFTLAKNTSFEHDMNLSIKSFSDGRKFCTKLWNCARFILGKKEFNISGNKADSKKEDIDILKELDSKKKEILDAYENLNFKQACGIIYEFFWDRYCNDYLESIKSDESEETFQILTQSFLIILHLLHPIIPFITEEIWDKFRIYTNSKIRLIESSF